MWGEWQLQGGEGKGVGQRWGSDECFEGVEAGALGFRLAGFLRHLKMITLFPGCHTYHNQLELMNTCLFV